MANTTNFGWETPDDTDLVKDGAAAMRTLGNSIDASFVDLKGGTTGQVLAKASNTDLDFTWSSVDPLTILDAKGDLITATAADTPSRLAVGANGTVLTADSAEATGLKWASPSAGANWTLLNAGGTSLTGAATITVSGISAKDRLLILVSAASSANSGAQIGIRLNTDTGNNYYQYGGAWEWPSAYAATIPQPQGSVYSTIRLGWLSGNANSEVSGFVNLSGCNSSGLKAFQSFGQTSAGGSNGQFSYHQAGYYNSSSTISSVSIFSSSGNFDNGLIYVLQSA